MAGHVAGEKRLDNSSALPDEAEARAALVLALRRKGVSSRQVLAAMERVPRRLFLSARHHGLAYEDAALPIECGQSVSAPSLVAATIQALDVMPDHSVLEIGTGSGYQAAVLSHIAERVETIDRFATLSELATRRFAALKLKNVSARQADGFKGLKQMALFDRIVVTAAVPEIPEEWVQQLKPNGVIIAAVGRANEIQTLVRYQKREGIMAGENLLPLRSVMMRPGLAERL